MNPTSFDNHFKDLFDNASDLIHFLKIDGTILLVNTAWLTTLGYTLNEVTGKNIEEFIIPENYPSYTRVRNRSIQEKINCEIDVLFKSKDGNAIYTEGQIGCSYDNGMPLYTRVVLKNVTLKKQAENKIAESEKRLNTLFKKGPDAIIIIDEQQIILDWNPKAEQIFGYTAEEAVGQTISEVIIPLQYREAHKIGMAHFLKTGEGPVLNKTIEITGLHKSGKEFYINLSISNVKVGKGWLFIAFLSDISNRKSTEEALIRKEAELMQTKILEEKRDEFISIASHELKTPLTMVKAYTQLAIMHSLSNKPDQVNEFLNKTDLHISKLNRLISELLDVSKIHAGKLELTLIPFDLSEFFNTIIENVQPTLPYHQITINKNDKVIINGDAMRLEQVIINLLTNAAKYSPDKNEIVLNSIISGSHVIISVHDNGIGIGQSHAEKIFDRFYRVDEMNSKFNGLGIGLFICKEIVNRHNGNIWVESEINKGSTFYLKIPLASPIPTL